MDTPLYALGMLLGDKKDCIQYLYFGSIGFDIILLTTSPICLISMMDF